MSFPSRFITPTLTFLTNLSVSAFQMARTRAAAYRAAEEATAAPPPPALPTMEPDQEDEAMPDVAEEDHLEAEDHVEAEEDHLEAEDHPAAEDDHLVAEDNHLVAEDNHLPAPTPAQPKASGSVSSTRRRSARLAFSAKPEDIAQHSDEPSSKRRHTYKVKTEGLDAIEETATSNKGKAKEEETGTPTEFIYRRIAHAKSHKVLVIAGAVLDKDVPRKMADSIMVAHVPNDEYKQQKPKGSGTGKAKKLTPGYTPFTYRQVPTPENCKEVHRILTAMHGEQNQPDHLPVASLEVAGCGEVPSLLDGLLRTLISGNTTMVGANKVIKSLAEHYGILEEGVGAGSINWEKIRLSPIKELEGVMRVGGLAPKKSQFIKTILDMVHKENLAREEQADKQGQKAEAEEAAHHLSLEHMHDMSKDEAMVALVQFPGVAVKTAACVSLFRLRHPCLAVDTHVHRFCCWLGWTPERTDPETCYNHVDFMVPDHLKYALHQLFIKHGQECFKCRAATKPGTAAWQKAAECPLEHLLDRSRMHGKGLQHAQGDEEEEVEGEE